MSLIHKATVVIVVFEDHKKITERAHTTTGEAQTEYILHVYIVVLLLCGARHYARAVTTKMMWCLKIYASERDTEDLFAMLVVACTVKTTQAVATRAEDQSW